MNANMFAHPDDDATLTRLHTRLQHAAAGDGLLDIAYRTVDTPVGALLLAATDVGLVRVAFAVEDHDAVLATLAEVISPRILRAPARLDDPARQLDEYFGHRRTVIRRPGGSAAGARVPPCGGRAPARYRLRAAAKPMPTSPPRWAVPARCAPSAPHAHAIPCRWSFPATAWCVPTAPPGQYAGGAARKTMLLELEADRQGVVSRR